MRIADNKTSEIAKWDKKLLKDELSNLDMDLDIFGFPVLSDFETKNVSSVEEYQEIEKTALKTLYKLGKHRLLCGNSCNETDVARLMEEKVANMCFTDPPYNVNYKGVSCKEIIKNDNLGSNFHPFLSKALENISKFTKGNIFICMGSSEADTLADAAKNAEITFGQNLFWNKNHFVLGRSDYQNKHENIFFGYNTDRQPKLSLSSDILNFKSPQISKLHPTMKPIELVESCINAGSEPGDLVLDLFGGSGTTLIACEKTGRTCYMMELSPIFCDRIIQRFEKLTGEKAEIIEE